MAAIPLWWLLLQGTPTWAYVAVLASGFAFGVWICEKTSQDLGVHDHGGIVFDEWIGLWLTLIWLPWGDNLAHNLAWLSAGFVAFRFFDILKPWPIRWLDAKVHGGFGIMIDDLIAGFFALACLQGANWLIR